MRFYLLVIALLSACAPSPTDYPTPVDFFVEYEVSEFDICVTEGTVFLVEDGQAIWTTQTSCLDETAGVFEDVVLRPGRAYRVRSDMPDDLAIFSGFIPMLDRLVTTLTLTGNGSCSSMMVNYTCENQDIVKVVPGPWVAGDRLRLPVQADMVDAALCLDPEGDWTFTATQLSSKPSRL